MENNIIQEIRIEEKRDLNNKIMSNRVYSFEKLEEDEGESGKFPIRIQTPKQERDKLIESSGIKRTLKSLDYLLETTSDGLSIYREEEESLEQNYIQCLVTTSELVKLYPLSIYITDTLGKDHRSIFKVSEFTKFDYDFNKLYGDTKKNLCLQPITIDGIKYFAFNSYFEDLVERLKKSYKEHKE